MHRLLPAVLALAVSACAAVPASPRADEPPPPHLAPPDVGTAILDRAEADKLLAADGITLQWIGWDQRGQVNVRMDGDTIRLTGAQADPQGPGQLFVDGEVSEIGKDYFILEGVVRITDTPDPGRRCEASKKWYFAVTQNRPYWRLREFEWCDALTDYVDIYQPGTKP